MKERGRSLVVRLSDGELEKVHALADAGDETVARLVRRWIRVRYEAKFGDQGVRRTPRKGN